MHTKPDLKTSAEDIGARLALTRRALILTRFQMARLLGIDVPTWGRMRPAWNAFRPSRRSSSPPTASRLSGLPGEDGQPAPAHPSQNRKLEAEELEARPRTSKKPRRSGASGVPKCE